MQSHKVSFATNIATKQIANISPSNTPTSQHKGGTNHKDNEDDTPLDDFDGTTPNQEWWDNDKLLLANPKQSYMVNSQITNGLFMKACMEICHGMDNFTANATIATQAHKEVIANEGLPRTMHQIHWKTANTVPILSYHRSQQPSGGTASGIHYLEVPSCFHL